MIDDLKRRLANNDKQLENLLMKKKLKIKFWKAEKALAMQILKQEGLPKYKTKNGLIRIVSTPNLFYETKEVYLRGQSPEWDYGIASVRCESNTDRDAYLYEITQAITDELFNRNELKDGEILWLDQYCEVRDFDDEKWYERKLIAILPEKQERRFVCELSTNKFMCKTWKYARPICKSTEPKVETNGEIVTYTWEEK